MGRLLLTTAFSFNPFVALVAAIVGAVVWTRSRAWWGVALAYGALVLGWSLADGVLFVPMVEREMQAGRGGQVPLVAGALAAFLIGYVFPAWCGAFVGKRVTRGTGWLSAVVVSATASGAMSAIAGRLG